MNLPMIVIMGFVLAACAIYIGCCLVEGMSLTSIPRIRRIPRVKAVKQTPEQEATHMRWVKMKERQREAVLAEKRLEERHKARADDLLEFDYRMEALMPHTEHSVKTRLSPRTGCYDCEQERQHDKDLFSLMISGI